MKVLVLIMSLSLSFSLMANDIQVAKDLFGKRGKDKSYAKQAAEVYAQLASRETDRVKKASLINKEVASFYFFCTHQESKSLKANCHKKGHQRAQVAVKLLQSKRKGTPKPGLSEEAITVFARSYYWYGAHLGKWGKAKGPMNSLGKWPDLEKSMTYIIDMKRRHVEFYGADRVLGRANKVLPAPFGSNKKSERHLKRAFRKTLNPKLGVSVMGLNNTFYAETLFANDKKKQACKILKDFMRMDPKTLLPERMVETKEELEEAKDLARKFSC